MYIMPEWKRETIWKLNSNIFKIKKLNLHNKIEIKFTDLQSRCDLTEHTGIDSNRVEIFKYNWDHLQYQNNYNFIVINNMIIQIYKMCAM